MPIKSVTLRIVDVRLADYMMTASTTCTPLPVSQLLSRALSGRTPSDVYLS